MEFTRDPQRDAWGAIRGFTFQIDRTIEAWIDLEPDGALECEAGEDIDFVQSVSENLDTPERVLEQVKYRQSALTLRTPALIEALSNFLEHRERNPEVRLSFRYLTNARPARERGIAWPQGLTGVDCWASLQGHRQQPGSVDLVALIRQVLTSAATRAEESHLVGFLQSASSESLLANLIIPFEIDTGHSSGAPLGQIVRAKLISRGYATDEVQADQLHGRLVVTLLRMLASGGRKELKPESLANAIRDESIVVPNSLLLRFEERIANVVARLETLTKEVRSFEDSLPAMVRDLVQASGNGDDLGVRFSRDDVLDPTPARPAYEVDRPDLLAMTIAAVTKGCWCSIEGTSGIGKTQLARSLAEAWTAGPVVWCPLGGSNRSLAEIVVNRLARFAKGLDDDPAPLPPVAVVELARWIRDVEGGDPLLLLDDVGYVEDPLSESLLASLAQALQDAGWRVASTSQHSPPNVLRLSLGASFTSITVPPFSQEEVRKLLIAAGSGQIAEGLLAAVHAATGGHPTLVGAVAGWMAAKDWAIGPAELLSMLQGGPLQDVKTEARDKVRRLIPTSQARDLLDRLSLVREPFDRELVNSICEVEPALPNAQELLLQLMGSWVAKTDNKRFEISALVKDVGVDYLSTPERLQVHETVGDSLLKKKSITPHDGFNAAVHFYAAESWLKLVRLMVNALHTADNEATARAFWWAEYFFAPGRSWPDVVPHHTRIVIRALQVRRMSLVGEQWRSYADDLDSLLAGAERTSENQAASMFALFFAWVRLEDREPSQRAKAAIELARIFRETGFRPHEQDGEPEILWWAGAVRASSSEEFESLMQFLETVSNFEAEVIFGGQELGLSAAVMLFDRFHDLELNKASALRDWPSVLARIFRASHIADRPGLESLRVVFARCRAMVSASRRQEMDVAISEMKAYLASEDPRVQFIANWTTGRLLELQGDPSEALLALREAAGFSLSPTWDLYLIEVQQHRMIVAAAAGLHEEAIQCCRWLVSHARIQSDEILAADHLVELAWLYWTTASRPRALAALAGALFALERASSDEPRRAASSWKLGHAAGWCSSIASTGSPPPAASDGEHYVAPQTGFTLGDFTSLGSSEAGLGPIYFNLGILATSTHHLRFARALMVTAADEGDKHQFLLVAATARSHLVTLDAWFGDFDSAIRHLAFWRDNVGQLSKDAGSAPLQDPELLAFGWNLLWPTLISLLAHQEPSKARAQLGRLRTAVQAGDSKHPDRLVTLVDMGIGLFTEMSWSLASVPLKTVAADDNLARSILYLSASRAAGVPLNTSAELQAIVFEGIAAFIERFVLAALGHWMYAYWTFVLREQSFRVAHPRLLRAALKEIAKEPSPSLGARLLLAIDGASGARYPAGVRLGLQKLAAPAT